MASSINFANIDETYPVAGQDNDSQGFRDNFQNIKNALSTASGEITTLQEQSPSLLTDNDFNDKVISKAIFKDTATQVVTDTISGETNIDFTSGHYRICIVDAEKPDVNTIVVTNWSPASSLTHMILDVRSNNANQKFLNFSTPSGTIYTDSSNLDLSSNFDMTTNGARYFFELWSPTQGQDIFIRYLGEFTT